MGNNGFDPSEPEAHAAERIDALQAEQDDIWIRLRQEDDPDARMALLARFSEVRAELRALTDAEETDRPDAASPAVRPDGYRVELVGDGADGKADTSPADGAGVPARAPGADPSRAGTSLSSSHDPYDYGYRAPGTPSPGIRPDARPRPGPAARPHLRSRSDPIGRPDLGSHPGPTTRPDLASRSDPTTRPDLASRSHPISRPDLASRAYTGARPASPAGQRLDSDDGDAGGDSRVAPAWRASALLAALAAVTLAVWILLPVGDDATESAAGSIAIDVAVDPSGPADDDPVEGIRTLLRSMGLDRVVVEWRDGTIHLAGVVPSDVERHALIGAAEAVAGEVAVDATGLVTAEPSEDAAGADRAATLQADLDRLVAATPIIFGVNGTELTELHKRILNTVATTMLAYPDVPVTIVGYTDDIGDETSNRDLSLARAESVRAYLEGQGVPAELLQLDAKGEDTSTGSEALANLERRVEFEVPVPATEPASDAETLRIAIVAPSARNDLAFTQSMVDAVDRIAVERGNVEVAVTDSTFVPEEATAALRGYAEEGYHLVIAHGSQFGPSIQQLAVEFPDVAFAWGTASDTFGLPNVYAYEAAAEQGGYVIGALAARLSGSGVLGVVGPIEVGDAQRYIEGFRAGAAAEKPGIDVRVTYTGSFSDLSLASEIAGGHLQAGADVLTGSAQMVVGAISVTAEHDAAWFGTQSDQSALAPDNVVASQVYRWEVILAEIVADLDSGEPGGRTYTAELANGGLVLEYNETYALPEPVRQRGDELVAAITTGAVTPPAG